MTRTLPHYHPFRLLLAAILLAALALALWPGRAGGQVSRAAAAACR